MARAKWHNQFCQTVTGQAYTAPTMLVDEPDNKVDREYGRNPNGFTLIAPDGRIIYYNDWFRYGDVDELFKGIFKQQTQK